MPVWTGLDGNSNLPILTWQPSNFSNANCSFAEQETTTKTSDNMQVYGDGNVKNANSGTDFYSADNKHVFQGSSLFSP